MTLWKSTESVLWEQPFALDRIARNLAEGRRTVLILPLAYHPCLSAQLYKKQKPRPKIDRIGHASLLTAIAEIKGLGALADLVEHMADAGARLRVRSPAPHLVFNVAKQRRDSKPNPREAPVYRGAVTPDELLSVKTAGYS